MAEAGVRFGRLTVVGITRVPASDRPLRRKWVLRCDCGREATAEPSDVRRGKVVSCGCWRAQKAGERQITHGRTDTREYNSWRGMIERCTNEGHKDFHLYGGAGVKVCDRWRNGSGDKTGLECFIDDMGMRPTGKTLDREDSDGNYEPGNCRWATATEQVRNRRTSTRLTHNGETLHLYEWADRVGIAATSIKQRLRRGWSVRDALSTPVAPR